MSRTRFGRVAALAALCLAAGVVVPLGLGAGAAEAAGEQADVVSTINSARVGAGLGALAVADDLAAVAQRQASAMASSGRLAHNPSLTTDVRNWRAVGENVGYGRSVSSIADAFMASPAHRANILDRQFSQVGTGAATSADGRLWVAEVFRLPDERAAAAAPTGSCAPNSNPPAAPSVAAGRGYAALARGGGLFTYGASPFYGAPAGTRLPVPTAALAPRPQGDGYWVVGPSGAVQDFGQAGWYGDARGLGLRAPVVSLLPTRSGRGYWLVTADGAVLSFGDAPFHGSLGSIGVRTSSPVVDAARTASGGGYWLVTANGAVFTFGDAPFLGATTALRDPVTSIAVSPDGRGYWLVARDGGIFSFGVPYAGSIAGLGLCAPPDLAVTLVPTATGRGYWVLGLHGGVFSFGDAPFHGAPGNVLGKDQVVDMVLMG